MILPAAGGATRFGRGDKLALRIAGRSVLEHGVAAFADRADVAIVVVVHAPGAPPALPPHARVVLTPGGTCRAASVRLGLERLRALPAPPPPMVAVHDAARPAVSAGLIDRVFAAALADGAAVPGVAVVDTVKETDEASHVVRTLRRASLRAIQTPQAMRRDWLAEAYARCPLPLDEVTDDAQLLELIGHRVRLVTGDEANRKLTRPEDLAALEATLRAVSSRP